MCRITWATRDKIVSMLTCWHYNWMTFSNFFYSFRLEKQDIKTKALITIIHLGWWRIHPDWIHRITIKKNGLHRWRFDLSQQGIAKLTRNNSLNKEVLFVPQEFLNFGRHFWSEKVDDCSHGTSHPDTSSSCFQNPPQATQTYNFECSKIISTG